MSLSSPKKHLIYIFGTFAFFLFTIADTLIKLIGNLYKDTVIFSIASFSAVIPVLIYLFYRKSLQEIKTSNYKLHIVRGILMTLTYYFIVKGIIIPSLIYCLSHNTICTCFIISSWNSDFKRENLFI
jgi:drug/metabolite transporter (DMT)-like permease